MSTKRKGFHFQPFPTLGSNPTPVKFTAKVQFNNGKSES